MKHLPRWTGLLVLAGLLTLLGCGPGVAREPQDGKKAGDGAKAGAKAAEDKELEAEVKESLAKLSRRGGFTWHEIDVDSSIDLRRQFNDEVPVVFIDGRKAFKYHMNESDFLRKLAG